MRNWFGRMTLIAVAFLATGCATQGDLKMLTTTIEGEQVTIGVHDQKVPNWMISVNEYKLNFLMFGSKELVERQLRALEAAEKICRDYTRAAHPHDAVVVGVDAIMFGAAGAAGGALGALAFAPYAVVGQYSEYAAASGGTFGGAYGALTLGGKVYTFENCGREVISGFPKLRLKILSRTS